MSVCLFKSQAQQRHTYIYIGILQGICKSVLLQTHTKFSLIVWNSLGNFLAQITAPLLLLCEPVWTCGDCGASFVIVYCGLCGYTCRPPRPLRPPPATPFCSCVCGCKWSCVLIKIPDFISVIILTRSSNWCVRLASVPTSTRTWTPTRSWSRTRSICGRRRWQTIRQRDKTINAAGLQRNAENVAQAWGDCDCDVCVSVSASCCAVLSSLRHCHWQLLLVGSSSSHDSDSSFDFQLQRQRQLRLPPANGVKINLIECEMKFVLTHTHTLSLPHTHILSRRTAVHSFRIVSPNAPEQFTTTRARRERETERETECGRNREGQRAEERSPLCPCPPTALPLYFAFD